jgi:hypothetical protein
VIRRLRGVVSGTDVVAEAVETEIMPGVVMGTVGLTIAAIIATGSMAVAKSIVGAGTMAVTNAAVEVVATPTEAGVGIDAVALEMAERAVAGMAVGGAAVVLTVTLAVVAAVVDFTVRAVLRVLKRAVRNKNRAHTATGLALEIAEGTMAVGGAAVVLTAALAVVVAVVDFVVRTVSRVLK